jgi:hypothetical protein
MLTHTRMHAGNECTQQAILDRNGTFLGLCIDCRLNTTKSSSVPNSPNLTSCQGSCRSTSNCVGIQYNGTSRECLLNLDTSGNTAVSNLTYNSTVEVWLLVKDTVASGYAKPAASVPLIEGVRTELLR